MLRILIVFCVIIFAFASCKKDTTNPPPDNTTSSPLANPNIYYGVLASLQVSLLNTGSTTLTPSGGTTNVMFSSVPMVGNSAISGTSLNGGIVFISGVQLKMTTTASVTSYYDSTNAYFSLDHNWTVSGKNGVPAINYSNGAALPVYTGYTNLVDTIHKGQNTTINLSGVSGADEISVYVSDLSNITTLKAVSGTVTTVSFSPTELSALNSTNNGMLVIEFRKNNFQFYSSKTYKFQSGIHFQKTNVIIKP